MSRPQKKRHVCCMPQNSVFSPQENFSGDAVILAVDEYEMIRLIDLEGCTQAECAEQMHVSRTTVQWVYNEARKKIADALVNGKEIRISGGDYIICGHYGAHCGRGCKRSCHKHQCHRQNMEGPENENSSNL